MAYSEAKTGKGSVMVTAKNRPLDTTPMTQLGSPNYGVSGKSQFARILQRPNSTKPDMGMNSKLPTPYLFIIPAEVTGETIPDEVEDMERPHHKPSLNFPPNPDTSSTFGYRIKVG